MNEISPRHDIEGGEDAPRPAPINPALDALSDNPFRRLNALLEGLAPPEGLAPVILSIGEPRHTPPPLITETLAAEAAGWGRYPPPSGDPDLRAAVAAWLTRRYRLDDGLVDPARHVMPVSGTREPLYLAAQLGVSRGSGARPAVLLPDPAYHVYHAAALMAGGTPVPVPAGPDTGFLPDFGALPGSLLANTAIAFLCTPANPQGAVADRETLQQQIMLARRHGYMLAVDEVYSELYRADNDPPPGALEACAALAGDTDDPFANVLVFQSLSKRSSAPGLRSGFVAGEARLIAAFQLLRSYGGCPTPQPIQAASAALWRDEAHVAAARAHYDAAYEIADRIFAGRPGYRRPPGGFFLWLDVGDGVTVTKRAWTEAGIKVLPGEYMTRGADPSGQLGGRYVRVALVDPPAATEAALTRLASVL